MIERIGGSIGFQLIDIFNILEDSTKSKEEKEKAIQKYQRSLTIDRKHGGRGIPHPSKRGEYTPNEKNGYFVLGDVDVMTYDELVETKKHVDNNLDSFTCEAEMKMPATIQGYDRESRKMIYDFSLAKKVYDYARSHGKDVRGHTLVYGKHWPNGLDEYIEDNLDPSKDFNEERRGLTKEFLKDYITAMGNSFPDCYCWDVMNEIVADMHTPEATDDGLKHSKWYEYLGKEWYIDVLEIARDNLPEGTKLFYNDYGEEFPEKRAAIIQLINNIKKYEEKTGKVLLDGIGLQSHYNIDITDQQLEDIYADFSSTGKEIQVTEMDISPGKDEDGKSRGFNPENMPKYERIWNKVFELAERYDVKAFTGWGINDALSWFKNLGLTMVEKNGTLKKFAENLFTKRKQKPKEQTQSDSISENSFQKKGKSKIQFFHDQKSDEYFQDMETGRYTISEQKIGKTTIYTPVQKKSHAKEQVIKDEQELEQGEKQQ